MKASENIILTGLAVICVLGALVFSSGRRSHVDRFKEDNAMGATANATATLVEHIPSSGAVLLGCALLCCLIIKVGQLIDVVERLGLRPGAPAPAVLPAMPPADLATRPPVRRPPAS